MTRTALLLAVLASACSVGGFVCQSDAQCGRDGTCDPSGWCSFPDPSCPSGQRFGEHSGDGLGGMCVPESGDGTGTTTSEMNTTSSSSSPASSASTSSDATLTMTSAIGSEVSTSDDTIAPDTSDTMTSDSSSETGEPDPSLLAWYSFDDPDALLVDASGNGRDATCSMQTCPAPIEGVVGTAVHFDGASQYAMVDHDMWLETMDAVTVTVWVSPDELSTGTWQGIVAKPVGAGDLNSWEIGFEGGSPGFITYVTDGSDGGCAETPWPRLQTWHHAALVWDGSTIRWYLDGEMLDSTPVVVIGFDDHPLMLGADIDFDTVSRFFAGSIDEVRIYDRALSDDEVAALAAD